MNKDNLCKLCSSDNTHDFFSLPPTPTQDGNMAISEVAAIQVLKGDIQLRFCNFCGHIRNEGYEAHKVTFDAYDFSNDHSPIFRNYVDTLTSRLIYEYDLKEKTILDIGCGDGYFLKEICKKGNNKGIGIDPGFNHDKEQLDINTNVQFIQDYYSEKYDNIKADFIACRLVIDLLDDPSAFISTIRKTIDYNPDTILYFEVPNALYTFKNRIVWNVVYEHATWYTPDSLALQFEACGFEVLQVAPCWNDEFIGIEVRSQAPSYAYKVPRSNKALATARCIKSFEEDYQLLKSNSQANIERIRNENLKTIAWGAGARAVVFFNIFDVKEEVSHIVDINTKRQGKFLPGSGQLIVAPAFTQTHQPDLIIITNPTYADEIKAQVHELGLDPEFWIL